MLIDEIVDFCDNEYSSYECTVCHKHHLCQQDCKNCLDDLHYHKNRIRTDYSCEHLLDYYVAKNIVHIDLYLIINQVKQITRKFIW